MPRCAFTIAFASILIHSFMNDDVPLLPFFFLFK